MKILEYFSVIFLLLILSACQTMSSSSRSGQRELLRDADLAAHESLYIKRPRLSPDGRTMVFDFIDVLYRKEGQLFHKGSKLALYDLDAQQIEVHELPQPLQVHSASFDATGRKLAVIVACRHDPLTCSADLKGTQIGIIDLKDHSLLVATDGTRPVDFWNRVHSDYNGSEMKTYTSTKHIVRGYPIFSKDGKKIYYVVSNPELNVRDLGPRIYPYATLMAINIPSLPGFSSAKEEVLLYPGLGPTMFRGGGGPLSYSGDQLQYFTNRVSFGKNQKDFNELKSTLYHRDLKSGHVSPALNVAEQSVGLDKAELTNWIRTPMSSLDGSRLLFIRGRLGKYLALRENGSIRNLLSAEEVGVYGFENSALSADGRWAVVLPRMKENYDNKDSFWLIDLETNDVEELPLRSLLRKALTP